MPHRDAARAPAALRESPLGRPAPRVRGYDPELLFALARPQSWRARGLVRTPFCTALDLWTAWELSWLGRRGLPQVAVAQLRIPGDSPRIVESKSLKLYLFSLGNRRFTDRDAVARTIEQDVGARLGAPLSLHWQAACPRARPAGIDLDQQDMEIAVYDHDPELLRTRSGAPVRETLHSRLLRSLCPVTGQPDWASVHIDYHGAPIDRAALLRYIVSYRNHSDFAEQCVERLFLDILERCRPDRLSVCCRYLRRGGLDINPCRSSELEVDWPGAQPRQ